VVRAANATRGKKMGLLRSSERFGVPRANLKDYVNNRGKDAEALVTMRMRRKPALPAQIENDLVNYCLLMEGNFFRLKIKDVKRMAFQLAIRNNLRHPFCAEEGKDGKKWLRNCFCRHPTLSLMKPRPTAAARIKGFTAKNTAVFFDIFDKMEK
jgi:hypothetical protein